MKKKETRGQPTALTSGISIAIASYLGWCVASAIVALRYKGKKWQSKAVVKMIQN